MGDATSPPQYSIPSDNITDQRKFKPEKSINRSSQWGGVCKAKSRRGGAKGGLGSRTGHDGGGGDWSVGWWAPIQTTSRRGVDLFSFFLICQGGAQDSQNSWRLRSDHDGGSGGHLLGQRRMQVREKATGDLLVFILVKNSPSAFTFV